MFFLEYFAKRLRTVDGLILPAPIETATLNISGSMVSIKILIDPLCEQEIEMLVANIGIGTEEVQALPIANTRLELNTEQMRQTKDCRALTLSVGVNRIGLNFGFGLHDKVEDVVALAGTPQRTPFASKR